jgi:hypothetical protein
MFPFPPRERIVSRGIHIDASGLENQDAMTSSVPAIEHDQEKGAAVFPKNRARVRESEA